ncbi:MAG: cytochrome c3 family protein [Actinomycetota bacterium]|nr:cytochrome c3 family protein [Actinomycetota bacterium]MDP3630769.1 cytochrome c3 family protein [Actinomycetota bacterium]
MQSTKHCGNNHRTAVAWATAAFAFPALLALMALVSVQPAYAFHEPYTSGTACGACHNAETLSQDCTSCHDLVANQYWYDKDNFAGPHGAYLTTTSKCDACHSVHRAPANSILLLPAATIVQTCEVCHDGTGGYGVYGTILAVTGIAPSGGHSMEATNVVPGGSASTGGSATMTFGGSGGKLICTDCHNPHGANVVNPFVGDRRRLRANLPSVQTNRLLRRLTGTATVPVDEYGSDWCIGCHAGRASRGTVHNHPADSVNSSYTVGAPYTYGRVPILASNGPTALTVLQGMGGVEKIGSPINGHAADPPYTSGNRGYLMPYPRTADQVGHAPICQQCHEDTRRVGSLSTAGVGTAQTAVIAVDKADGLTVSDNPRFQNFPHETQNPTLLVEINDDLCLNCHPEAQLP